MRRRRVAGAGLLVLALVLLGGQGCGSSTATISGEVTYDGQPVGDGSITLTPADGKGPVVGGEIREGKYAMTKITPGPKVARIEAYKKVNFASSSQEMMDRAAEAKKRGDDSGLVEPADVIPPNAEGNNQKVEIKRGDQKLDFHLKKPTARKR
jgi:hypothetical protein